jgi:GAF domain-containing protein
MAVPILIGERVLGVLDLQSNVANALNTENASVFLTLAAQIAIAIENIILYTQAEEARKETEERAKRLTQEGWEGFLNAVDRSEQIGYTFDSSTQIVAPTTADSSGSPHHASLSAPILITGNEVGTIHVEGDEERHWTKEETELIQAVAVQVARQIENLRLLTQAEQSRVEAELATRRLTREGWQDLVKNKELAPGYVYDLNQVSPLAEGQADAAEAPGIAYPLKVGYETIGELKIQSLPDEASQELVATVADQLSLHLENLRLAEQTQSALGETQTRLKEIATLNQISQAISAQTDIQSLFDAVRENLLRATQSENIYIALYDEQSKSFEIPFMFEDGKFLTIPPTPLGRGLTSRIITTRKPLLIRTEAEAEALGVMASSSKSAKSYLGTPMIVGDNLIGVLAVQDLDREYRYDTDDMRFLETVASQIAVAVQNTLLFEQTRQRAEREAIINTISQRIQSTATLEDALETATREIGTLLKAKRAVVEISGNTLLSNNGH